MVDTGGADGGEVDAVADAAHAGSPGHAFQGGCAAASYLNSFVVFTRIRENFRTREGV